MNYPIVYDKFETAFSANGIAVLQSASNVKVREVINGEFLLSFILPRTDPKWKYLQPENFVKVYDSSQKKDQLFRVRSFEEQRDNTGKLTANIQCEHVWYDANDCKHIPNMELIGVTPFQVLTQAFSGTRFTIGSVEITTPTDIFLSKTNPAKVTNKLIENVGGELVRDNWTIHLLNQRGSNNGVHFRIGKNIESIKKSTDIKSLVTRLYPYGKDDMPINNGTGYIDSPLINNYDRPHIGAIDYKDIEDPALLLTTALKEWSTSTKDGIDKPKVTYQGTFLELKKLKEYGELEAFCLGDTVKIVDEGIETTTNQRVVEYEFYPYDHQKSVVSLANYDPKVYRDSTLGSLLSGITANTQSIEQVTNSQGQLNPNWFENIKTKLKTLFNGIVRSAVVHTQGDIWVDNPDNPTKAIAIIADGFAIANSKDASGNWQWKTFGTADGFTADLITAGKINAIDIIGSLIQGATINGGNINVSSDIHVGNILYLGSLSDISRAKRIFFNDYTYIESIPTNNGIKIYFQVIDFNGSLHGWWNFGACEWVSGLENFGYATKNWVTENFVHK